MPVLERSRVSANSMLVALSGTSARCALQVYPTERGTSPPPSFDCAIFGSLGFALVRDVLYVRLLCSGSTLGRTHV